MRDYEERQTFLQEAIKIFNDCQYHLPSFHIHSASLKQLPIDEDAVVILQKFEPEFYEYSPLQVKADGNSLFNAAALFLRGRIIH